MTAPARGRAPGQLVPAAEIQADAVPLSITDLELS
jgi:hypothetical protein